ncbi:hypothetical protein SAY87_018710 [Trapa incisa]|uniref:HVA22-like protein n=1 Tax=Trapa incisa TaxID=236973 RepID=A0AAN7K390_9MYRT|nr:hypothetical protein SAY87_018710 [Trapa incisa]
MALLNILERVADVIISWLPMYGELKLAFIIYLWYPKTKGTGYIYETVLRPLVTNHETDLEKKLPEWRAKAWDLGIYYWQNCSDLGQSAIFQALEYMADQSGKSSKSMGKRSSKKISSPPPPPNDTPTFYKPGKNMKQSQTSDSSSAPSHQAASETPKFNTVQAKPDARTEYVQIVNGQKEKVNELGRTTGFDVPWSHSTKNKLYLPRISFRRSRA